MAWPFRRVFRVCWWLLCTATLCALPLTIWEFKNQGWSPHYQGMRKLTAPRSAAVHIVHLRDLPVFLLCAVSALQDGS